MLDRQREFVADASHELRTPLTEVLANLELLDEVLDGEQRETAALARCARPGGCAGWSPTCCCSPAPTPAAQRPHEPTDLAGVLVEAAAELGPIAARPRPRASTPSRAIVEGARDELHRLVLNLMENAIKHTAAGTRDHARTVRRDGDGVVLVVEDDGPGVPAELRRARLRALRARRRRPRRLVRPRPVDRPRRRRAPRRHRALERTARQAARASSCGCRPKTLAFWTKSARRALAADAHRSEPDLGRKRRTTTSSMLHRRRGHRLVYCVPPLPLSKLLTRQHGPRRCLSTRAASRQGV